MRVLILKVMLSQYFHTVAAKGATVVPYVVGIDITLLILQVLYSNNTYVVRIPQIDFFLRSYRSYGTVRK